MNSASTDTYNAEDYEWKDDHLGLDLSRVPTQPRDPPVEASLEELKKKQLGSAHGRTSLKSVCGQMIAARKSMARFDNCCA